VIPKRNYFKFAQYAHNLEEAGAGHDPAGLLHVQLRGRAGPPMIDIPIMQIRTAHDGTGGPPGLPESVCWADAGHHGSLLRAPAADRGRRAEEARGNHHRAAARGVPGNSKRRCGNPQTPCSLAEIDKLSGKGGCHRHGAVIHVPPWRRSEQHPSAGL